MMKGPSIPESHSTASRRRQIAPDNFAALLAALDDGSQEPGTQYENLRSKLIFFFSRRQFAIPEDLADEVLDRLANRISEGSQILSAPAFALGIARHVAQEQNARRPQMQSVDETFWYNVPAHFATHNEEDEEAITRMEKCLERLPKGESKLLRDYYLTASDNPMRVRKSLADRLGISANTLRQRVFLARQSLRACMTAVERKRRK